MNEQTYQLEEQEISQIRELYEKKLAFENLAKILKPEANPEMYQRLVADYGEAVHAFDNWWSTIFQKYSVEPGNYSVDFRTNQITLTPQS